MTGSRRRPRLAVPAMLALLLLAGCSKTVLYTGLSEGDANEMLALLMSSGIGSEKAADKTGVSISVDSARVPDAVALLNAAGLPHKTYANMGTLFQRSGMISSPSEDRVRYIYGLSQELGHTISLIDGVLNARVHIVLPGNDPSNPVTKPSSAAVLIRYSPDATIDTLVPKIKELVVNSVEGLSYDHVSVVLVRAAGKDVAALEAAQRQETGNEPAVPPYATYALAGVLGLSVVGNGALGWLLWRRRGGERHVPVPSAT
jgi:type III secretion protein J